ncbi:MAG TPA: hypothetical protein VN428_19075 [Bryobacteraceae bacterium]|nr:hypothetical protein [Bryobacteraceae bacterium]
MRLVGVVMAGIEKWPPYRAGVAILLIAAAVRVALLFATGRYRELEASEIINVARSLAESGIFGDPYALPTGPTAHANPAYPFLLSLLLRWTGPGGPGILAIHLTGAFLSSLGYALLPWTGRQLGLGVTAGVLAGCAGAVLPFRLWVETGGTIEVTLAGCVLMLIAALCVRYLSGGWQSIGFAAAFGFACGAATLVYAGFLPCGIAVLALTAALRRRARAFAAAAVAAGCVFAVIAPWMFRNYQALGSPVLRSNLGLELAVSNRDGVGPDSELNMKLPGFVHPHSLRSEAELVRTLGEVEYNRRRSDEARDWIRGNPVRFGSLTARRALYFWFNPTGSLFKTLFFCGLTAAGIAGWILAGRRRLPAAAIVAVIWMTLPLPHYVVHVSLRHRYPMDWTFYLGAAYLATAVIGRITGTRGCGARMEEPVSLRG